jgi:hypothetical protein
LKDWETTEKFLKDPFHAFDNYKASFSFSSPSNPVFLCDSNTVGAPTNPAYLVRNHQTGSPFNDPQMKEMRAEIEELHKQGV